MGSRHGDAASVNLGTRKGMCSSTSSHSDSGAHPGLESTLILESAVKNGGYKHGL